MEATTPRITFANHLDHFLARWAVRRSAHRVDPGLYAIGSPNADSPVFVTANYTLSFDALRKSLDGISGYILVLDTKGVNVWCAAGKGTFGTDELVGRIEATNLKDVVNHRKLILPQLGGPGVAAHVVKKRSGFKVLYGPVEASDIVEYMKTGKATPAMRKKNFPLPDRIVLIPVEFVHVITPMILIAAGLYFVAGLAPALAAAVSILAGAALFPVLLPMLPTSEFSTKGFFLGAIVSAPFVVMELFGLYDGFSISPILWALVYMLAMPPVTAFLALNFTGSSAYASRTGVKREIQKYTPKMAYRFVGGMALMIALVITGALGVN